MAHWLFTKAPATVAPTSTPAERRILRKLDWNLMSIFFVLYLLASLDRGNVGNARIAGMATDLHLTSDKYDWLLTIFYITYIVFEFCVLLWKIYPPHLVGTVVVFFWGLMATLCSAAQNWSGLMVLRFFLGIFEAAFGPGVIFLLSFFYLRHEVGFRCGIFVSSAPLASTFSGALAYGITSGRPAIASWRLLFLVEGLPTICMAPIAYFFIPDSPDQSRFLNAKEKEIVRARTIRQTGTANRIGGASLREFGLAFIDIKAWLNALMYFSTNVSYSSLPVFLPTILQDMGYGSINAQGLSAPPSFAAFICALITTWIADRTQQRAMVITCTSVVGGIGYIILATVDRVGVRYFATFLASAGVFSTIPNICGWTLNNQGSDTRRGTAIILVNLVGQCGPLLGTRIFPSNQGPRYIQGMSICAGFMFFCALLAIVQRCLLCWENKKLDELYGGGKGGAQAGDAGDATGSDSNIVPDPDAKPKQRESEDEGVLEEGVVAGSENYGPNFRYVL